MTPDLLALARRLAAETGRPETEVLALIASSLTRELRASRDPIIRGHLALDLQIVQTEISAALERDLRGD